jgi:hypothetical protein
LAAALSVPRPGTKEKQSNVLFTFIRTYAEEENCEAIFRRSESEFIILRIPKTENWPFQKQKICGFGFGRLQETTFFFVSQL